MDDGVGCHIRNRGSRESLVEITENQPVEPGRRVLVLFFFFFFFFFILLFFILLFFEMGLELSLQRLMAMRNDVFVYGGSTCVPPVAALVVVGSSARCRPTRRCLAGAPTHLPCERDAPARRQAVENPFNVVSTSPSTYDQPSSSSSVGSVSSSRAAAAAARYVASALLIAAAASAVAAAGSVALGLPLLVVIGGGLALSSSAFVLQLLRDRDELGARHGRAALGILLFQDLAAVPLLVVVPLLAKGGGAAVLLKALALASVKAALALGGIFALGGRVFDLLFYIAAKSKTQEAFLSVSSSGMGRPVAAHGSRAAASSRRREVN